MPAGAVADTSESVAVEPFEEPLARNYSPEQVQEFIPLPMTRACVQFVTGKDPLTMEDLHVPRGERERRMQKALVRWKAPESRKLVEEALTLAGRTDLLQRYRNAVRGFNGSAERVELDLDTCG